MADSYHPSAVEAAWQDWWEARGFYSCDPKDAVNRPKDEKFVMVIPPPNVTGSLHLGHALTAAVEDTMTRWHRMKGHATLYVPGKSQPFHKSNMHGSSGQPGAIIQVRRQRQSAPCKSYSPLAQRVFVFSIKLSLFLGCTCRNHMQERTTRVSQRRP
jgi:hypothetical protein